MSVFPLAVIIFLSLSYASRRHVSPVEQGGASQRSAWPQQVCPGCRAVRPLDMKGIGSSLFNDRLPQCGQAIDVPARTSTSNVTSQLWQRYS